MKLRYVEEINLLRSKLEVLMKTQDLQVMPWKQRAQEQSRGHQWIQFNHLRRPSRILLLFKLQPKQVIKITACNQL